MNFLNFSDFFLFLFYVNKFLRHIFTSPHFYAAFLRHDVFTPHFYANSFDFWLIHLELSWFHWSSHLHYRQIFTSHFYAITFSAHFYVTTFYATFLRQLFWFLIGSFKNCHDFIGHHIYVIAKFLRHIFTPPYFYFIF